MQKSHFPHFLRKWPESIRTPLPFNFLNLEQALFLSTFIIVAEKLRKKRKVCLSFLQFTCRNQNWNNGLTILFPFIPKNLQSFYSGKDYGKEFRQHPLYSQVSEKRWHLQFLHRSKKKGGRPTKYTTAFIEAEADAFEACMQREDSLWYKDFALKRGYLPDQLSEWAKTK